MSTVDEEVVITPDQILDNRNDNSGRLEILVQWVGLPVTEASWVGVKEFRKQFPTYQL